MPDREEDSSKLLSRFQEYQREMLDENKQKTSQKPAVGDANAPVLGHSQPARSVPQIISRHLPITRLLDALLPRDILRLSDLKDFDALAYDNHFRLVFKIVDELEEQFELNDDADHPRLNAAARTLLDDRALTARMMVELLGHMRHMHGDNTQTWKQWSAQQRNSATVILYHYLLSIEELLKKESPHDNPIALAIPPFITYATPTAFLDDQQPYRYRAIKKLLMTAANLQG